MMQQQRDIKRKLVVLRYAEECGNVALTARRFGISRQCFYIGKRASAKHGETGLINKRLWLLNMPLRMPAEVGEKTVHLRRTYHFGPVRIAWYLERYQGLRVSSSGVYPALSRHGLSRLPGICRKRSVVSLRLREAGPRPPRPARREAAVQGKDGDA